MLEATPQKLVPSLVRLVYHRPPVKQSAIMHYMNRLEQQQIRLDAWRESNKVYAAERTYTHKRYTAPHLPKQLVPQCICRVGALRKDCFYIPNSALYLAS